jgi:DNA-binding CsgD family transcriptional regulator
VSRRLVLVQYMIDALRRDASDENPLFVGGTMKRRALVWELIGLGLVGGVLIAALRWSEYQFLVMDHSVEIYGALVAAIFAGVGIWLGLKLTRGRERVVVKEVPVEAGGTFAVNETTRGDLGITRRELEILELVALGMSNREIAGKLFVSENTVKTHCSRAFDKLGAKRRTQAVQMGKELGLLR